MKKKKTKVSKIMKRKANKYKFMKGRNLMHSLKKHLWKIWNLMKEIH